jgi:hypothetical protein
MGPVLGANLTLGIFFFDARQPPDSFGSRKQRDAVKLELDKNYPKVIYWDETKHLNKGENEYPCRNPF